MEKMTSTLKVKTKELLTPSILRVVAGFIEPPGYSQATQGGYVKLLISHSEGKLVRRTVSISEVDESNHEMSIDFVQHEGRGPAAMLATSLIEGDEFNVLGPGFSKTIDVEHPYLIFMADLTAFAALKRELSRIVQVQKNKEIKVILDAPEFCSQKYFAGVFSGLDADVFYVSSKETDDCFSHVLKTLSLDEGLSKGLWCAGERLSIQSVRQYVKNHPQLNIQSHYISSYWQRGLRADQHVVLKKQDSKA